MIYLDNAATTKTAPGVVKVMLPYFTEYFGNPSGIYGLGSKAKTAINSVRKIIADSLGAEPEEIFFTSGGSEADNWALKAVAEGEKSKGKHIITDKIEHPAILQTCAYLEQQGYEITYLDVDEDGMVNPAHVEAAIRPDTILVSIMFANNEVGTLEPIEEIGKIARAHGVLFHTDAVQAFGHVPIDVEKMHIDLLSASGHKLYGPKGVGFLYVRKGCALSAMIHGGAQERNRRAGTENVPGIVGLGTAAEYAKTTMEERYHKEVNMRDYLIQRLEMEIPQCRLNGSRNRRLSNNVSFSFDDIEGESLLIRLDMKGICASAGSACSTGSLNPSHVLLAMGRTEQEARGTIRLSLSHENTMEELDYVVNVLKETVAELRKIRSAMDIIGK